jgi:hypothetical protein
MACIAAFIHLNQNNSRRFIMPIFIILSKSRERSVQLCGFRTSGAEMQRPENTIRSERPIGRSGLGVYFTLLKRLKESTGQFFHNFGCLLTRPENARRWVGRSLMISGNHCGWRDSPSRSGRYPGVCFATALLPTLPAFPFSF